VSNSKLVKWTEGAEISVEAEMAETLELQVAGLRDLVAIGRPHAPFPRQDRIGGAYHSAQQAQGNCCQADECVRKHVRAHDEKWAEPCRPREEMSANAVACWPWFGSSNDRRG